MCLNVEERFHRNDCCVGVGLPEQFREVGISALLKGGLGGFARSFAAGALGNTLTCCDRDEQKKGCDRWCLLVPALLKLHVCAETGSKVFGYVSRA